MLPVIENLLVLQDRDRRLRRIQAELDAVPAQRLLLQTKAAKAAAEFETVRKRVQQIESDRKKLELEVDTLKDRIGKVRSQQNDTRSNEQYKAYQHQIQTTEGEISKLEDQQLTLMELAESGAKEVAAATRINAEVKAETDRHLADLATREARLNEELDEAADARDEAASRVDDATLSRYERLVKTKGDNVIVGVGGGVCGGCHVKLTTQATVSARGQAEIVPCPNCGRILYFTSDMG
jgi:hypothetical protein